MTARSMGWTLPDDFLFRVPANLPRGRDTLVIAALQHNIRMRYVAQIGDADAI